MEPAEIWLGADRNRDAADGLVAGDIRGDQVIAAAIELFAEGEGCRCDRDGGVAEERGVDIVEIETARRRSIDQRRVQGRQLHRVSDDRYGVAVGRVAGGKRVK